MPTADVYLDCGDDPIKLFVGVIVGESDDVTELMRDALHAAPELAPKTLVLYARLWSLEIWLRRMVYVELKAGFGDEWEQRVSNRGAERSKEADARLTHMPTNERHILSYSTFGDLCDTIVTHWSLFAAYLPPTTLWNAKLEEIRQIRNRIAHFRRGHDDDLPRVEQFLRDLDPGFFRFCTSYNDPQPVLPPSLDPVVSELADLEVFPYTEISPGTWARVGTADRGRIFSLAIQILRRPSAAAPPDGAYAGQTGFLYDFNMSARHDYVFDYREALTNTRPLHHRMVHVMIDNFGKSIRVTLPAVLGKDALIEVMGQLVKRLSDCLYHGGRLKVTERHAEQLLDEWPEYVIGGKNPLTFLDPSMRCSFFGA